MKTLYILNTFAIFLLLSGCGEISDIINSDDATEKIVSENISNSTPKTILQNSDGVKVTIPQGAVPLTINGEDKPLTLEIEQKNASGNPSMIDGNELVGKTWHIKPDNFIFQHNIEITIPVNIEADKTYSLYHLNQEKNRWEPIAFSVEKNTTSTNRSLTNFITTLTTSSYSGGFFSVGGDFLHHQDTNSKRWGVIKIENFFGERSINYCIVDYQLKYADDKFDSYMGMGHILAKIDGLFATNPTYIRVPQGKYQFNIERMSIATAQHPAQGYIPDGWFTTKYFDVAGTGVMDFDNTDLIDSSTFDVYIGVSESTAMGGTNILSPLGDWILTPPNAPCSRPQATVWGGSSSSTSSNSSSTGIVTSEHLKWDSWPDPQWCSMTTTPDPTLPSWEVIQHMTNTSTGHITCEYDTGGHLTSEIKIIDHSCCGKIDGYQKSFYPSGDLETQVYWEDGVVIGPAIWYDEQGNRISCYTYKDGVMADSCL